MTIKTLKASIVEELFDAGGHLGHRNDKTDASMKEFVFRVQNKISVINLDKSAELLVEAVEFVKELSAKNQIILFVGTKRELSEIVKTAAIEAKMPYVVERWIGGMLTNFKSVKKKIDEWKGLEAGIEKKKFEGLTKKERQQIEKKIENHNRIFSGIKDMQKIPEAILIFDTHKNDIALREAAKLSVKIIGINDMKRDREIDKFVPINDESRKAMKIIADAFVETIKEAKK